MTDDWPDPVPVTEAEIEVFERWLSDVALIFAAPAAVAGYALVHGITKEAVPSDIWRQISVSSAEDSLASLRGCDW
ncbi:hypothetical protein [Bosea sp. UNC402CLCol]|uniref:hypothetical protein n=1 Tax=Bosea sp. UNC402CLCol TaxID=1510531 RepID=UPI000B14B974|nr:hypothetical protein [Bosea sp. UNC402CLCol]